MTVEHILNDIEHKLYWTDCGQRCSVAKCEINQKNNDGNLYSKNVEQHVAGSNISSSIRD